MQVYPLGLLSFSWCQHVLLMSYVLMSYGMSTRGASELAHCHSHLYSVGQSSLTGKLTMSGPTHTSGRQFEVRMNIVLTQGECDELRTRT